MSKPRCRVAALRRLPGSMRPLALAALVVTTMLGASVFTVAGFVPSRALAQESATPVAGVTTPTPEIEAAAAADPCPDELTGPGSEPWVQVELYFSQPREDTEAGTDDAFMAFLDTEVTPRFPDGLTLLSGIGQWRGSDGDIRQRRSHVLIILIPGEGRAESAALIEEIRDAYEEQFDQESVLRADTMPVCTSF